MPKCVVKMCKNNSREVKKRDGISYFHFPVNLSLKEKWRKKIAKERQEKFYRPNKSSVVCSDHFSKSDMYYTAKGIRRLKRDAVLLLASQKSRRRSTEHLQRLNRELCTVRACKNDALSDRKKLVAQREEMRSRCERLRHHVMQMSQTFTQDESMDDSQESVPEGSQELVHDGSQELTHEEGQEEWLSEGLLTDDDCNPENTTADPDPDRTVSDLDVQDNLDDITAEDLATTEQIALETKSKGETEPTKVYSYPPSKQKGSKRDDPTIEQTLNSLENTVPETKDEIEAFLVKKSDVKKEVKKEESDGNDTDDLLRMLEDDDKSKKTKKTSHTKTKNVVQEDDNSTDDDDDFIYEGATVKKLTVAKNALIRSKYPVRKAEPEDYSDDDDDETSDEGQTLRRTIVRRREPAKPVGKPVGKPVAKPVSQAKTAAKPVSQAKTAAKPVSQPKNAAKPVNQPKSAAKPVNQPKSAAKPVNQPKSAAKPMNQPNSAAKPVSQAKSIAKPVSPAKSVAKPVILAKTVAKPVILAKTVAKPVLRVSSSNFPLSPGMPQVSSTPIRHYTNNRNNSLLKTNTPPAKNVVKVVKAEPPVKVVKEPDEIINEEEFMEEDDFDLDEDFAEESDSELDKRAVKQRIMKPEQMDEEMPSDAESNSDDGSLFDELSSDSDNHDEWFTLDIRAERAGEYLPLLGSKAFDLLTQERKRVNARLLTLRQSLSLLTDTGKLQAEKLKKATSALADVDDMLKAA